jgi:DNA-binding helix-hairpin-helix protein with protein kinase domain
MEGQAGRPLFMIADVSDIQLTSGKIDSQHGYLIDLKALLAMIQGVALPSAVSITVPARTVKQPSQKAREVHLRRWTIPLQRCGGVGLAILAIAVWAQAPMLWLLSVILLVVGWQLIAKADPSTDELERSFRSIEKRLCDRIRQLQETSPMTQVIQTKQEIMALAATYQDLCSSYRDVEKDFTGSHKKRQKDKYLSTFLIRRADIEKLKSSDVAALASFGITTALDVQQKNVRDVFGIGPVKEAALHTWVDSLVCRL